MQAVYAYTACTVHVLLSSLFPLMSQGLRADREKEQTEYETRIAKMEEDNATELQDLEDANNKKLMTEYEKYQELQARSLKLQEVTSL